MQDILEYWPLVFAFIAYLLRARKNRKGKPASKSRKGKMERSPKQSKPREDPFKKILDDFFELPEEKPKQKDVSVTKEKEQTVAEKIESIKNASQPEVKKATEINSPEIEVIEKSEENLFDLRQAIINEAILNRPK